MAKINTVKIRGSADLPNGYLRISTLSLLETEDFMFSFEVYHDKAHRDALEPLNQSSVQTKTNFLVKKDDPLFINFQASINDLKTACYDYSSSNGLEEFTDDL